MDDLISRQAAIDAISEWGLIDGLAEGQAIEILGDEGKVPSAQPGIIRCGECTHKDKKIDYCHRLGITICECDYCSFAERRPDGSD